MKNSTYFFPLIIIILTPYFIFAQTPAIGVTQMQELPTVYIYPDNSVHFLSPQPIKYVDISSHKIHGDLPVENMLRIKFHKDSTESKLEHHELGTLTIVAEDFIAQYRLCYSQHYRQDMPSLIEIPPSQIKPLNSSQNSLSQTKKKDIALNILAKKTAQPIAKSKDFGITMSVNQIYTIDDYMFLDISFINSTNLSYDIDEFRFFLEDNKILKESNYQSLEIKPIWEFKEVSTIKSKQRNIFVIKKVIFPSNKVLRLSLTEKQISGRIINTNITYKDVLNAPSI